MSKFDVRRRAHGYAITRDWTVGPWIRQAKRERELVAWWRKQTGRLPAFVRNCGVQR